MVRRRSFVTDLRSARAEFRQRAGLSISCIDYPASLVRAYWILLLFVGLRRRNQIPVRYTVVIRRYRGSKTSEADYIRPIIHFHMSTRNQAGPSC
jgi:hypothetical protein